MRICMVMSTPFPPEEGIGNYVYNLSRKLIEKSHRVTVITRSPTWRMQTDIIRGVDVFRVPFIPCYPFHVHVHRFFVNKLFKTLESNFDIVHIHTPLCPVVKTSLPVVTTVHSPMVPDSRLATITDFRSLASKIVARSISYQLELNLLRRSNMITAVSKSIAQELEEYGLNPDDVVVQIYSGPLDVDRNIVESSSESMVCLGPSENGTYTYEGFIPCDESGLFGYSVRIFPSHVDMADNFHLELMRWINNPETISSPVNKSKIESVSV